MASSFMSQIPTVLNAVVRLEPTTMLDIGKGYGKYGFLVHEFLGVPASRRPDPAKTLAEQSDIAIDAVEVQPDYMWPHIPQFYRHVYQGDIMMLYQDLPAYDVVLMADVIEHLEKADGIVLLKDFLAKGAAVVVSTPKKFFNQHFYESEYEAHRSHWTPSDFDFAPHCAWQNCKSGRVYVLSNEPKHLLGFGNAPTARARRVAGMLRDEFV
jgi:hypothetical protein